MEFFESKSKEKKKDSSFQLNSLHSLHSTKENFDDTELLSKYKVGAAEVSIVKNRHGELASFVMPSNGL